MQESGVDKFLVESIEFIESWGFFFIFLMKKFYKVFINILLKDTSRNFLIWGFQNLSEWNHLPLEF